MMHTMLMVVEIPCVKSSTPAIKCIYFWETTTATTNAIMTGLTTGKNTEDKKSKNISEVF